MTLREAAVPALLLAAAPLLTRAAAHLRAPKPLQWLIGLAAAANVPRATASGHCLWPLPLATASGHCPVPLPLASSEVPSCSGTRPRGHTQLDHQAH